MKFHSPQIPLSDAIEARCAPPASEPRTLARDFWKARVALRLRPLHRARRRQTRQPWVAFAPRRSRRCVVVDRVSSLAARSSSVPGCAPSSLFRRVASARDPTRGSSGTSRTSPRPSLTGTATLSRGSTESRVSRVCAARLAASFARSPVALTVRRRACGKVFTMTRTARRRDGAGSTRRGISRVRVPRPLRASMRAAPRGGALGCARVGRRASRDASHAGCFIRVFAYSRDAFHVFWSFDTDPFVPPRLHSSRPLASSSRSTTLVSHSRLRDEQAHRRGCRHHPPPAS